MFDLYKYKTDDVFLCSLSNDNGSHIRKEPFVSERNTNYIINQQKNGKVLKSLRNITFYYHIDNVEPIADYLDNIPGYLSKNEILKIANTVNENNLKPKVKQKVLNNQ